MNEHLNKNSFFEDSIFFLEKIKSAQGTINKSNVLAESLKKIYDIKLIYDATYNNDKYGLNTKTFSKIFNDNKKYSDPGEMAINNLHGTDSFSFAMLSKLIENVKKLSGNNLIEYLRINFSYIIPIQVKWIVRMLNKDLRIGLNIKSINKVYDDLGLKKLEMFGVQLCVKFKSFEEIDNKLKYPFTVSCKYDGMRAILKRKNGVVTFTSRQGELINYVPELVEFFEDDFVDDFVIDGEIDCGNFSKLSARIGRKLENIEPIESLHFRTYDILSYNNEDYTELNYSIRRKLLRDKFWDNGLLKIEECISAYNLDHVRDFYNKMVDRGEEGIVIKLNDKPYEKLSRKNMFKLKPIYENTFKITGAEYGSGKYSNLISILHIIDGSRRISSKVGTGLKDNDRIFITELYNKHELLGKFIDVKYNEVSSNKSGGFSLRHPAFLKFRDDKCGADIVGE